MRLEDYTLEQYQVGDLVFGYRPGSPPGALFDPSEFTPGSAQTFFNSDGVATGSHSHNGSGFDVSLGNYSAFRFESTASLSSEQSFTIATSISEAFTIYGDNKIVVGTALLSNYSFEINNFDFAGGLFVSAPSLAVNGTSATGTGIQGEGINGVRGYSSGGNAIHGIAQYGGSAGFFQGGVYIETYGVGGTRSDCAALEVNSTSQGVLIPRMTTTQINAITDLEDGLLVYNTTLSSPCFYDGTALQWKKLSHSVM